ncbi:MAG: monofunctional biosynthetic peptidoglycan transglycosylase [Deltaproteobacteria bacterium]|nr:monofunctional biosynthetic peptidoglycan transglycosylase [Deltaproteobacteria bacterium]
MLKKTKKRIKKIFLYTFAALIAASFLVTLLCRFIPIPLTPYMVFRAVAQHHYKIDKTWVRLQDISPHLIVAVIAAEDQRFLDHHGFDVQAIRKAFANNQSGKKIKGGSTISQQTAKNLFLWPSRSWFRKGLEAYFTLLIELCWSKQRILEVYLNIIEMGKGIYGVEAASQHHFNRHAKEVSAYQAAMLTSIIPSPIRYNLYNPGTYIFAQQDWILTYMKILAGNKDLQHFLQQLQD